MSSMSIAHPTQADTATARAHFRMTTPMQVRVTGFVWYRREDYGRALRVMEDGHALPTRYKDWLQRAERGLKDAKAQGVLAEKVYLDPETFPRWCFEGGLDVDAKARIAFANESVADRYRNQS
ncbi:hypothetical protein [Nisaea sp.]|uniref:hypothetical protein n=1 Tax=Nisaea sp. TaxID=2024842 RepID=UPI003299DB0D